MMRIDETKQHIVDELKEDIERYANIKYTDGYIDGYITGREQTKQRWVPVSERQPEEYEYVLLCDREPEPDECTDYSQMAVGWLEDGQICCWDDRATGKEFVAWMPLPEPYKGEK